MNHSVYFPPADRLRALLDKLRGARIGVVGDICLDVYHEVDLAASEPSLETGVATRPVRRQRLSPGGAGNVIANLRALGVGRLAAFAVIGPDMQGRELARQLEERDVDCRGLVTQAENWQTPSYLKPMIEGREDHRYDFGVFNRLAPAAGEALVAAIRAALPALDVLVINQQFTTGVYTDARVRTGIHAALAEHPGVLALSDCRQAADDDFRGARKLNDLEATRLCGRAYQPREQIPRAVVLAAAETLFARWRAPLFITRGERGCLAVDGGGVREIPGLHIVNPVDAVGAGDSLVAGVAATLAVGATPAEAAALGNLVAGVTVQKLHQTGTAAPEEVWALGQQGDYVYRPELAEDARLAVFAPGTEIEIAEALPERFTIRHAIFDHDGTISTLRQGWEDVMEPMMVRAILGPAHATAERRVVERVTAEVRAYIDRSTGLPTLRQMHELARMVRVAGFVPEAEVLDAAGYKRIYNEALMARVRQRRERLARGELGVEDFTIKNAVALLRALRAAGVRLHLASGTDEPDVKREAEALGYAELFEGRIYGANQDVAHEAKRMVLEKILDEIGPAHAASVVTFGDGPVEIRETRKRGGLTVGVASDELRRFGLDAAKRTRVIRAGAHLVVGDYAQLPALLRLLRIPAPRERAL